MLVGVSPVGASSRGSVSAVPARQLTADSVQPSTLATTAGSLVYIKGGNVWLASPDGSYQRQVTRDGSDLNPYYSPSQANDGTIVAVKGDNAYLHRMDRYGNLLNAPFETASPRGSVYQARVSPDGAIIGYSFFNVVDGRIVPAVMYTLSNRLSEPNNAGMQLNNYYISWLSSSRTLLTADDNTAWYDDVGGGNGSYKQWFADCDYADCNQNIYGVLETSATRTGDKLALVREYYDTSSCTSAGCYVPDLLLLQTAGDTATGQPPATPVPKCQFQGSAGATEQWQHPSWSPDGKALAFSVQGDGIYVVNAASLADCTQVSASGVITGGSQPDWGPVSPRDTAPPSVKAPTQALVTGSQLGATTIPVKVSWQAATDPAGIAGYQLRQRQYSGSWGAWSPAVATTSTSLSRNFNPGTYQFSLRAQDKAGNWSNWVSGASFGISAAQETSAKYSSNWGRQSVTGAYGGYTEYSTAAGSYATYSFTGRQVAWVAPKSSARGQARVYVDGASTYTAVNLYSASTLSRQLVLTRSWSSSGAHTLKIVVAGTSGRPRVDVDGFAVIR